MSVNGGVSPTVADSLGGVSPPHLTESPNHSPSPFISSTFPVGTDPSQLAMDPSLDFSEFGDLTNLITSDATITSTALSPPQGPTHTVQSPSSDVRINVGKCKYSKLGKFVLLNISFFGGK